VGISYNGIPQPQTLADLLDPQPVVSAPGDFVLQLGNRERASSR